MENLFFLFDPAKNVKLWTDVLITTGWVFIIIIVIYFLYFYLYKLRKTISRSKISSTARSHFLFSIFVPIIIALLVAIYLAFDEGINPQFKDFLEIFLSMLILSIIFNYALYAIPIMKKQYYYILNGISFGMLEKGDK